MATYDGFVFNLVLLERVSMYFFQIRQRTAATIFFGPDKMSKISFPANLHFSRVAINIPTSRHILADKRK